MYNLPYFKEKDEKEVLLFMQQNPFVILSGVDADHKPVATHIPVLLEQKENALYLYGHVMRNTDHHKAFEKNPNVLAIFTGAHTYVSASLYSNPQQASTWNYITVHAKGTLHFLNDDEVLLDILKRTTSHFENNIHSPSLIEKLPNDYVTRLMKAIVAFEIKVTTVENVFKLSQNRDEKSYENIIEHLSNKDEDSTIIAAEMKKRKTKIFPS